MYRVLTILLVFASQISWGQDENVVLSIEPRSADVGETIIIRVKTKVHGDIEVDNLPSSFVSGHSVSTEMKTEIDYTTGAIITYYSHAQTGAFGKSGKYTIGPAYVKKGNKTYKSNTVTINIGDKTQMTSSEVTAQQLRDPAFGIIQTNKTTIYEGEPLLVSAKVYAHFNPTYLDKYLPYSMKGAIDKHPIGNSAVTQTTREQFKGMDLYAFEYDKNIIFPVGTGDFKVSSYSMTIYQGYQNFSLTSSSADITIKPLPTDPPADFIGAVGVFDVERELEEGNLKQGDVFKMKIIVSGTGNLQNILEPTPILPKGFVVYGDPQIEENFSYTSGGTEGSITYEYNIQVSKYGDLLLPPTTISYFDIKDEQYVAVSTDESTVKVKKNKNFVVEEVQNSDVENLEEIDMLSDLRKSKIKESAYGLYGTPIFWFGVGTPLMAALLFIFFTKRRKQSEDKIAIRQTIRKKDQELNENIAQLKVLMAAGENNAFYSKIETTLKKAFELEMQLDDGHMLNKQEIFDYLEKSNRTALAGRVQELLAKCDQYRFGFTSNSGSNQSLYDELDVILKELKS